MGAFQKFVTSEWYFAVPMFLMSLTAITLVVWRVMLNLSAATNLNEFIPQFQEHLQRGGTKEALKFCQTQPGYIPSRLYVAGLDTSKQGLAAMRRAMANVIEMEILPDLNFLLPSILSIAKIATMVGLLGTVLSMINTFSAIQAASENPGAGGGTTAYAGAIGLALFATALGLVTAIPLVFAHVHFKAWIAKYEIKMRSAAQKLLVLTQEKGK